MALWTDLATWRGPTANQGGPMVEWRGLVVHIAEGSYDGTISWQRNPSSQVSSHFVVDLDGKVAQVVDTATTAWTQRAGNGHWLSVENAGFTPSPLTTAQVEANAQLLARAHRAYGVPLQVANDPTGRGLGHHSMGSHPGFADDWGHSDCPGPAIIAQKAAIVARAQQITIDGGDMNLTDKLPSGTIDVGHALDLLLIRTNYLANVVGIAAKLDNILAAATADTTTTVTMSDADRADLAARLAEAIHVPTDAEIAKAVNDDEAARLAQ